MAGRNREIRPRIVLGLIGIVAAVTGANVGFGGIATLGLEGPRDFFQVLDRPLFDMHDSHARYLGGLWLGMGLLFLAATVRLDLLRPAVLAALALMFVGGLSRLTQGGLAGFASPLVGISFAAEMILVPATFWRVWVGGKAG